MADSNDDREEAFDRIVHQYYRAIENGQCVNADDFIGQYPDFKDDLESFFAGLDYLGDYGNARAMPGTLAATPGSLQPQILPAGPGTSLTYVGEYRILEEIARGGMGVVFKARQEKLRRTVALKMILSGHLAGTAQVERFQREARAAAAIKHPNIVCVHEIGVHQGQHYFTMDYVESESLRERLRQGSLVPLKAAELVETLARATHFAHNRGIVHRDLKPANVLLDSNEQPYITDFGLAKPIADSDEDSQDEITRSGQIIGTPSYMAPEQATGRNQLVGVASDIYSLGAILYASLSGRAPFVAESSVETIRQVIHDEPLPIRVLNPRVPKDLETICLKCLNKEPHRRYGTAEDLADDLRRFHDGRPVIARPISRVSRVHRWAKRNPWIAATAVLLLLIALISPPVAILQSRQANEIAELLVQKDGMLQRATEAEQEAIRLAHQAKAESQRNRRLLYIADMQRMEDEFRKANMAAMREMLLRHVPEPGEQDLRDIEWYYWRGQCDSESLSWEHEDSVERLEISSDAQFVASCSYVGNNTAVQIRDAVTGRLENEFVLPGLRVSAIQFRNELELVVAGRGSEDVVLVVDGSTGKIDSKLLSSPAGPNVPVSKFVFSESGRMVAHAFLGRVSCNHTSTGQSLRIDLPDDADITQYRKQGVVYKDNDGRYIEFLGELTDTSALAFSSSEDWLAAGSREGRIKVWQLSSGKELLDYLAHDGTVWDIDFSSDDQQLVTAGSDGLVRVWEIPTSKLLHELEGHSGDVRSIDFGPGGYVLSGGVDRLLQVWALPQSSPLMTLRGNEAAVNTVRFSKGSCWTAGADRQVRKWHVARKASEIIVADPASFESVDLAADNRFVAASGLRNGVSVWNLESGRKQLFATPRSVVNYPIYHVRIHHQSLWGLRWDGSLFHWDLPTGRRELRRKFRVSLLSRMPQVAISPDGSKVAIQHKDGRVTIESTADADVPSLVLPTHDASNVFVKFSLDGKLLLTNAMIGAKENVDRVSLQLWNADSGKHVADISRSRVYHFVASNTGRVCFVDYSNTSEAITEAEGRVVIWDQKTQQEIGRYSLGAVEGLAISPDGTYLAVVQVDDRSEPDTRNVSIRHSVDGSEIHRLPIGTVKALSFSADGTQLIVAAKQGRIGLVDVETGQIRNSLVNPAGGIESVAYAPDDKHLVATFANRSFVGSSVISLDNPVSQKATMFQKAPMFRGANVVSNAPTFYLPNGKLTHRGLAWRQCELSDDLKILHRLGERTGYLPETIASDANRCFFLAPDRTLFRCDLTRSAKTQHTASPLMATGPCAAMTATKDGCLIAIAFEKDIQIYDGSTLGQLHVIDCADGEIRALTFNDDGTLLACGGLGGVVDLWNTENWSLKTTILSHTKRITGLRFSYLGHTVVSASEDGTIVMSDVETGSPKTVFDEHNGAVRWIEFSIKGDEMASAGDDGTIRRWFVKDSDE